MQGKSTNRIKIINLDSIIYNKEFKITKNYIQLMTTDNLKIKIDKLVIK